MFKTTIKGSTTMLPKALLTAGLLGGAALSTLGAGSAQAAWNPSTDGITTTCTFSAAGGCTPGEESPIIVDKRLTFLDINAPGLGATDTFTFEYRISDVDYPWHVDLDLNSTTGISTPGSLAYKIDIVGCQLSTDPNACSYPFQGPSFKGVQLLSARESGTTVSKTYGTGWNGTSITGVIDTLNAPDSGLAYGSTIYVQDVWTAAPGVTIDNINNNFSQVPAPLPLLGAGAVFGSIRKLRKFSSQLKTFSLA
jgi:hypothetical protein